MEVGADLVEYGSAKEAKKMVKKREELPRVSEEEGKKNPTLLC